MILIMRGGGGLKEQVVSCDGKLWSQMILKVISFALGC